MVKNDHGNVTKTKDQLYARQTAILLWLKGFDHYKSTIVILLRAFKNFFIGKFQKLSSKHEIMITLIK